MEADAIPKPEALVFRSMKRTFDLFSQQSEGLDEDSKKLKFQVKIRSDYDHVKDLPPPQVQRAAKRQKTAETSDAAPTFVTVSDDKAGGAVVTDGTDMEVDSGASGFQGLLSSLGRAQRESATSATGALIEYKKPTELVGEHTPQTSALIAAGYKPWVPVKPTWHAPWKLSRVIAGGHLGWVRCVAVDPSNEWFVTGSADRTIKVWDLASCELKLTLTGHISSIRGLVVSPRHPYLFSASEDKEIKCWDLEQNKVIRNYHGHLSAVYSLAIHPTLDVIVSGGRDSAVRVWDIRTKRQVHCLEGHTNTVFSVACQAPDPQIISGSADSQVRTWDLAAGKCQTVITNHKKGIRSLVIHPEEHTFASASADNIKKFKLPEGNFMDNFTGHKAIINTLAVNRDGVMVSGADNGSLAFWDWKSCHRFQETETVVQPGSLSSEAGVLASTFDMTGSRLITCESDKSIKIWKEDDEATPETHPLVWKPKRAKSKY